MVGRWVNRPRQTATANLALNGSFVDHADGWFPYSSNTLVGHDTPTHSADGSGAMKLASISGAATQLDAVYLPHGVLTDISSAPTLDAVIYAKGDGHLILSATTFDDVYGSHGWDVRDSGSVALDPVNWTAVEVRNWTWSEGGAFVVPKVSFIPANGATSVELDDFYVGPPGQDAPPYAGASVALGNRVGNGDFESGIGGWDTWDYGQTLDHDTATPISGSGSLVCACDGAYDDQYAYYSNYDLGIAARPGETVAVSFKVRGDGDLRADANWRLGGAITNLWTGSASATPSTVSFEATVPSDSVGLRLMIGPATQRASTFTIDDISVTGA